MNPEFTCTDAGEVKVLLGTARTEAEIAPMLSAMLRSCAGLTAFDHHIAPAGQRFVVTLIAQSTAQNPTQSKRGIRNGR